MKSCFYLAIIGCLLFSLQVAGQSESPAADILRPALGQQSAKQVQQTLQSVKQLDRHPLYEMTFVGDYDADAKLFSRSAIPALQKNAVPRWGCSIFVAYGKDGTAHYGRNFDWQYNPALLLHTHPTDGYSSISMVDISYLGFSRQDEKFQTIDGRRGLLAAPLIPFDGINEHGLVVGMAAVQDTEIPSDPEKPTAGSLQIIRLMLDHAKTVDEALEIMNRYNIVGVGGPLIHYLIADADGNSVLVEQKNGKRHLHRNESNWQLATNFYVSGEKHPLRQCPRFSKIHQRMLDNHGTLSIDQTFKLLGDVAQPSTRWSVVYDLKSAGAHVAMSRRFDQRYRFSAKPQSADANKTTGSKR